MGKDISKIPADSLNAVISKLQSLEPHKFYAVSNLIDLLQDNASESEKNLTRDFMLASAPALWQVWDNEADDIYDRLYRK